MHVHTQAAIMQATCCNVCSSNLKTAQLYGLQIWPPCDCSRIWPCDCSLPCERCSGQRLESRNAVRAQHLLCCLNRNVDARVACYRLDCMQQPRYVLALHTVNATGCMACAQSRSHVYIASVQKFAAGHSLICEQQPWQVLALLTSFTVRCKKVSLGVPRPAVLGCLMPSAAARTRNQTPHVSANTPALQ
jgi:hypothetical protein